MTTTSMKPHVANAFSITIFLKHMTLQIAMTRPPKFVHSSTSASKNVLPRKPCVPKKSLHTTHVHLVAHTHQKTAWLHAMGWLVGQIAGLMTAPLAVAMEKVVVIAAGTTTSMSKKIPHLPDLRSIQCYRCPYQCPPFLLLLAYFFKTLIKIITYACTTIHSNTLNFNKALYCCYTTQKSQTSCQCLMFYYGCN